MRASRSEPSPAEAADVLPPHYFRHEHGRLVSVLARRFTSLELCEDAAQVALLRAVETWPRSGRPDDPGAWLYRVAHHALIDALRRERRGPARDPPFDEPSIDPIDPPLASELPDDLLRMLFACADPSLPPGSQIALALKTLCGFSTEEIALRLFQSPDAIHKRLQRARARLRELGAPDATRVPSVLQMLYLLFNEGYSSALPDSVLRRELCDEAMRLTRVLAAHALGPPEAYALLALMCFHASRFDARSDGVGGLLLLKEHDRSRWDRSLIEEGVTHLHASARGDRLSRYHVEANIAALHALAPTYDATPWAEIEALYATLAGPLPALNRAIALAEHGRTEEAITSLERAPKPPRPYYLWEATWAELRWRIGQEEAARAHLRRAIELAPTNAERALLERRRDSRG